jgi:hypothetical protein
MSKKFTRLTGKVMPRSGRALRAIPFTLHANDTAKIDRTQLTGESRTANKFDTVVKSRDDRLHEAWVSGASALLDLWKAVWR